MKRGVLRRFDERGLKLVLAAFFFALAVPAAVLIAQAYTQLKYQAFRSTQVVAEELAARRVPSLANTLRDSRASLSRRSIAAVSRSRPSSTWRLYSSQGAAPERTAAAAAGSPSPSIASRSAAIRRWR